MRSTGRGSWPISRSPSLRMSPVSPGAPYPSMYSDQPTIPSSVVILRNELTRQPASQCRSSTLTIFMRVSPKLSRPVLQLRDACPGAVLILLRGAATDAAGALDDAVADDRDSPLA